MPVQDGIWSGTRCSYGAAHMEGHRPIGAGSSAPSVLPGDTRQIQGQAAMLSLKICCDFGDVPGLLGLCSLMYDTRIQYVAHSAYVESKLTQTLLLPSALPWLVLSL